MCQQCQSDAHECDECPWSLRRRWCVLFFLVSRCASSVCCLFLELILFHCGHCLIAVTEEGCASMESRAFCVWDQASFVFENVMQGLEEHSASVRNLFVFSATPKWVSDTKKKDIASFFSLHHSLFRSKLSPGNSFRSWRPWHR